LFGLAIRPDDLDFLENLVTQLQAARRVGRAKPKERACGQGEAEWTCLHLGPLFADIDADLLRQKLPLGAGGDSRKSDTPDVTIITVPTNLVAGE